jgi:fatty acid desaturase
MGLVFIFLQQALFGLYMASVFAPNHKGMLIIRKDEVIDFLRLQVLTARNVRAHPITDFWYGGLNYQIEHHLFPSMARNQLREAQKIIRQFCDDLEISYHETSMFRSYVEILEYLHEVSAPLRQKKLERSIA